MSERLILPFITDAHDHVIADAYSGVLRDPSLSDMATKSDALLRIEQECIERVGQGYQGYILFRKAIELGLTAEELDGVSQGLPIIVLEPSNHGGVANSLVLGQVRTFAEGKTLHGQIADDGHVSEHYATVAKNMAFESVGDDELSRSLESVLESRLKSGTSYVHDMGVRNGRDLKVIAALRNKWADTHDVPFPLTRAYIMHLGEIGPDPVAEISGALERGELTREDLSWIGIKFLADGTLGSRSAYLKENYADVAADAEFPRGFSTIDFDKTVDVMERAADIGIREVAVHAIGDQAIDDSLRMAERWQDIAKTQEFDGTRFRIEHIELPSEEALQQIKQMGIWAGPQPNFLTDYGYVDRLGEDRIARISPHKTMQEAGVNMMFGTDRMPASPLFAIWCAMHALYDNQRLTFDEALTYFTETPARFEGRKGSETVVFDASLHAVLQNPRNNAAGISLLARAKNGEHVDGEINALVTDLRATFKPAA